MLPSITKDGLCWPSVETTLLQRIEALRGDLETAPVERAIGLQAEIRALRWVLAQAEQPIVPLITPIDN